jgi:uncharacterized membrane protein YfcA
LTSLCIFFGFLVGLSLGLTGGGGAIFAVPLLVYGLGIPTKEAIGISLAAVGATSFIGFLNHWKQRQVEIRTGFLFVISGMLGAPLGAWLGTFIPDAVMLLSFAGLMIIVAVTLWRQASRSSQIEGDRGELLPDAKDSPACRRDTDEALILNSQCTLILLLAGLLTGVLSGLFGVGGGFVIVPALVLFSRMSMHRAVGTSLMVIAFVSVAGITAHLWAGREIPPLLTSLFVVGGIAGLFAGQQLGRRLAGPVLQKVFVFAILMVATFVIVRNLKT